MKASVFTLLVLFLSLGSNAQNKAAKPINLTKQTWKVDSIGGFGIPAEISEKLSREMGSMGVSFMENGRAWILVDGEMVLMDYDVSKGNKGTYLNFSGVVMMYFQFMEVKDSSLILGFQYPKAMNSELMKFYLSRVSYNLVDSVHHSLTGDYLLQDHMYSPAYDAYGYRMPLSGTTHMRLFEDGKMTCNFGTLDSGTWLVDAKKMELRLQGQLALYHLSIESYLAKTIRVKGIAGVGDTTYTFYKSPFADFEDEGGYENEVVAQMDEEMMAVDTMPIDYDAETYIPEKTQYELFCNSWQAYHYVVNMDNGESSLEGTGIFITFNPDGTVNYTWGKKGKKGSWRLQEDTQTLILNWGKKEEIAQFFWDFYYNESYETNNSLLITFTPPGEKKVQTLEFRPVLTE